MTPALPNDRDPVPAGPAYVRNETERPEGDSGLTRRRKGSEGSEGQACPVLRLHLTDRDLSRTVIRDSPAVMEELLAAGQRMMHDLALPSFGAWTGRTR